ncbi:MAG: trimeric intracellular cation channel family protein, partial [Tannerella sp.]|nr:trimeric intracellular cation channel family protein [Tannerella sp.]
MEEVIRYVSSVTFVKVIEFAGTIAFAISGVRLAAAKEFDWFGAFVVGFVTAIGGGTVRDLLLDVTPFWMLNPVYVSCSFAGLVTVIVFSRKLVRLDTPFFIFDTIGLALFVVVGIEKTVSLGYPFWVAIIMGTITGVVGGIIRDIFIHEIPLVFRKEVYALACIFGGLVYYICYRIELTDFVCEISASSAIFIARVLAVKYRWGLPRMKSIDD